MTLGTLWKNNFTLSNIEDTVIIGNLLNKFYFSIDAVKNNFLNKY